MIWLFAFLFSGVMCALAETIYQYTNLSSGHINTIFVISGVFLEAFNIYDNLISFASAGALVPISNFGHSMTHSAIKAATEDGILGLFTGIFDLSSSGISFAVFSAFVVALVFRPKG